MRVAFSKSRIRDCTGAWAERGLCQCGMVCDTAGNFGQHDDEQHSRKLEVPLRELSGTTEPEQQGSGAYY
jgi:hypothetical protein